MVMLDYEYREPIKSIKHVSKNNKIWQQNFKKYIFIQREILLRVLYPDIQISSFVLISPFVLLCAALWLCGRLCGPREGK